MKKLIITLIIAITATLSTFATEVDTLWFRIAGAGVQDLDFTPDDKYVIAWTNAIEFWEVQQGVKEYSIPIDAKAVGDYNYNKQYLVFAKDSTPKLLDWQTKEVVEGFEKAKENIGRIRTAKYKNEFMANTFHEDEDFGDIIGNTIYFYNIDNKTRVDSISFVKQFEKGGFKWKKTIHDYDYCGNNDEFIYIEIDDVNDEIENIPHSERQRNYYVNFYDRETKELLDSVFVFQNTDKFYGGVNKLVVMNDRSKIAWNNKGGVINFFDVYTKKFYDKFIYQKTDSRVRDLDFTDEGKIIAIADGSSFSILNFNSGELLQFLDYGIDQVAFPKDSNFFTISGGSFLSLYKKKWLITNVPTEGNNSLIITPNPVSKSININFNFDSPTNYKFALYDLTGNQINIIDEGFSTNLNYEINYDISYLPNGTYFIKLTYNNQIITKQFIKE